MVIFYGKYNQVELKKNKLAQAIFSNDGPYLKSPDVTKRPKVTPNKYKANNKKQEGTPSFNTRNSKKRNSKNCSRNHAYQSSKNSRKGKGCYYFT